MATQLIQARISDPSDSLREFTSKSTNNRIPLVLIPHKRWCCSCTYTVPSGIFAIEQKFGKDLGENVLADPGLRIKCSHTRVAYCITQQSCTYNAPVKSCPTSDNVMVDVDLTLVFRIGPHPKEVKNFVYNLGAARFNEFLKSAVEEGIRELIRSTPHHKIYELRGGAQVAPMLLELNEKFKKFGVMFTKAAITDVHLGDQLAHTLQATTEFDSKIKEAIKGHENTMKKINHAAAQKLEELRRHNERLIQDIHAGKDRAIINREKQIVDAENHRSVNKTKTEENAQIEVTRAESQKAMAHVTGQQDVEGTLATIKSETAAIFIRVERECKNKVFSSEQRLKASEAECNAIKAQAEAEALASSSLKVVREHQLRMAKLEVLEVLGLNSKVTISGAQGDKLISEMLSPDILGKIELAI